MRALPEKIKRKVGRFFGRKAESGDPRPPVSPELRERAAEDIRVYAEENEALFSRASRFEEKAERLDEGDGATSESAKRRAERARAEIRAGLSELRSTFASTHGEEGRLAFDAELDVSYRRLGVPGEG